MTDYGHDLLFGTFLMPRARDVGHFLELASLTERVGLDLITLPDHPYHVIQGMPDDGPLLDTMTALAMLAARQGRVRLAPNVANLPLRPPAMLARAAATIDVLSGGRFELALGAGAMWDRIAAEGGPRRNPRDAFQAVAEAIQIIRGLWSAGPEFSFDGRHYSMHDVYRGPAPLHDMRIWIGAYQPGMLRLIGRVADGWLPSSPYFLPENIAAANALIDEGAASAGRSPRAIRRLYNIQGNFQGSGSGFLQGGPKRWVEQLVELTLTQGVSGYILYLADSADEIRRFGTEVAPAVREAVARARA